MILHKRILFFLFPLLLLWGCATPPPPQPLTTENWPAYQQRLQALTDYTVKGKLGYISPQDRVSLNFYWKQEKGSYEMNLSSFMGGNVLNLKVTPQGAVLIDSDDNVYHGSSAERLIFHLTGFYVPVDQMVNWIKGLPIGADSYQLNDDNRVATLLKDNSWQVKYRAYQNVNGLALPQNVLLQQDNTRIKLVMDSWELK